MPTVVDDIESVDSFILASDGALSDNYGWAVALSGDGKKLAAGAYTAELAGLSAQGLLYTYEYSEFADGFYQETVTVPGDTAANDNFGVSVAISRDGLVMAVGARGKTSNQGAVYVYDWVGGAWNQRGAYLQRGTPVNGEFFGASVALSDDGAILCVGVQSYAGTISTGAVFTYDWNGSAWVERAALAENPSTGGLYAGAIALSGDGNILAVGAYTKTITLSSQGAVYIYDWSGAAWVQRGTELVAADAASSDNFGSGVALSSDGSLLSVGAKGWEGPTSGQGGVYRYRYNTGTTSWDAIGGVVAQKNPQVINENFGSAIAVDSFGTRMAVGVPSWDGATTNIGAVYLYDIYSMKLAGVVTYYGAVEDKTLRAYERSTGRLVGETVSGVDGVFSMGVKTGETCFIVGIDLDTVVDPQNAVVFSLLEPVLP